MLENNQNMNDIRGYITPLFWQHGEDEDTIRNEIVQMHLNGIGGFIVESRPHPDFLGEKWWHDVDIIIDEAKKRDMKVWFFDDSSFPSGYAAGRIRDNHPEYLKVYLDERHIDSVGPLVESSFIIDAWLDKGESLVSIMAARRIDGEDRIDGDSLTDLNGRIYNGRLYWDVPEGEWRLFLFVRTRKGGEDGLKYYLNNIEPEPVKAFIRYVYEEFYKRYKDEFGKTIAGFFSDEPRFGNACTYEGIPGRFNMHAPYSESGALRKMVLPYSDRLLSQLDKAWDGDFKLVLPCLWYDAGTISHHARYVYMDVVSRLFGECYTQQIGDWCRTHNVKYIGHVVEDNGAHARLGYGAGHFFRAIKGQDHSGLDIVYQVWPELTSGRFSSPFGYLDCDFFYWGLAKMASSAGHIDSKKDGRTVCEIFGAYGWQEGLKLMKWLTDHVCVRGVNWLIPHAFSPKYPDADCPPHFYAAGRNPQWRYFNMWSGYANRVCRLLTGGRHVAPVAVVYHAEAEWSGCYMPFEKVVKVLAQRQIDCDVIPIDTFVEREAVSTGEGYFRINEEEYKAVVVPYAERLPEEFIDSLLELAANKIHIVFINSYPTESSNRPIDFEKKLDLLKGNGYSGICQPDELTERLEKAGLRDIAALTGQEHLRCYHYDKGDMQIYFLVNESKYKQVNTVVDITNKNVPVLYDAMDDKMYNACCSRNGDLNSIKVLLEPYQSIFIIFTDNESKDNVSYESRFIPDEGCRRMEIECIWDVYTFEAQKPPVYFRSIDVLCNLSVPGYLPMFSGTFRYEAEFEFYPEDANIDGIILDLGDVFEIGEVWLNGKHAGSRICPPYRFDVTGLLINGHNKLRIDVTNTFVKKYGSNPFDRAMAQEPSGLLGPVRLFIRKG